MFCFLLSRVGRSRDLAIYCALWWPETEQGGEISIDRPVWSSNGAVGAELRPISWNLGRKTMIFGIKKPQFFILRAQRLDNLTGHTRRPKSTHGSIFRLQSRRFSPDFRRNRPQLGSNSSVAAPNGSVDTDFTSLFRFWPPGGPINGQISRSSKNQKTQKQ